MTFAGRSPAFRAPAVKAALIQCISFPIMLALVFGLARITHVSYLGVALIQGALAAAISVRVGLARWWWPIQFLFPVLLLTAQSFEVSPWVYLGCFLVLLVLYWSTFRTQVPYYPSGPRVWAEVLKLLPQGRPVRAIDIGSGLGGLVLELAKKRPESQFIGIELAPLPWLVSYVRAMLQRSCAEFVIGDYEKLDFAQFDLVFAYLSPAAMPALWQKAKSEMRPGSTLLSFEFDIPGAEADLTILPEGRPPSLKVWHF